MIAHPYWITSTIAIIPRPRGGDWLDDEMSALKVAGIDVVVSMLETEEARSLGLDMERTAAEHAGLSFVCFPISDRNTPQTLREFTAFLICTGKTSKRRTTSWHSLPGFDRTLKPGHSKPSLPIRRVKGECMEPDHQGSRMYCPRHTGTKRVGGY